MPNKPGKLPKGQYYKSGGKIGGRASGSDEFKNVEVGKKITQPSEVDYNYAGDPSELIGKYQFADGSFGDRPVLDTRSGWSKFWGAPNNADDFNTRLALEKLTREELIPIIAKEEETKQGIITESVLERLKNEQDLNKPFLPVVNNFNAPGEVPFEYAGEPSELLADRTNQPYVPINPAGVQGNLLQQQNLAQAKNNAETAGLRKSELEFEQTQARLPKPMNVGNALFMSEPGKEPSLLGTYQPGYEGSPTFGKDAKGNTIITPMGARVPGKFEYAPKKVGNIYGGGAGIVSPPMLNTAPTYGPLREGYGYGPASTQQNEFVTEARDGQTAKQPGPTGSAPTTQPPGMSFDSEKFKRDWKHLINAWRWFKTGGSPGLGYDPIR